ncbi:SPASM domain-containing protein, partial [Candidatus Fermentibacterales bacterium]|nr:SPASM domain-containing protein [Candidatus Fermentibacterales bacterium]
MSTHSRTGSHVVPSCDSFFAAHGHLRVPALVQWMATLRCRMSCEHCLSAGAGHGFDDMPLEDALSLVDQVAAMGVREFLLTGGEPLAREDLTEIIAFLGSRGVSWSLNTAVMPTPEQRSAMQSSPPGFVAVSLDGPEHVHDRFRGCPGAWGEAMEAIRFFSSIPGVRVCAGTTVTTRNLDHLEETFGQVVASGADQWGIHLLVPEGLAAFRGDLFLSARQLERLMRLVERKRRWFPVELADETGYLGDLEPLVRELPLSCGAGRSGCVVLPDGEVVPCTTLDRSTSAGNIGDRPLEDIWQTGFAELRSWRPEGECASCRYAPACRGGCWLQRRAGRQCLKQVWEAPGRLGRASSLAICLGGLLAAGVAEAEEERLVEAGPVAGESGLLQGRDTDPLFLDRLILDYYLGLAMPELEWGQGYQHPADDPGWRLYSAFVSGTLPGDLDARCEMVLRALQTGQRSLSLAAMAWRALCEPILVSDEMPEYDWLERELLQGTLSELGGTGTAWRREILRDDLDPYLAMDRLESRPFFLYSKAGPRPGDVERYMLSRDLEAERWGAAPDSAWAELTAEDFAEAHPWAEQLQLRFRSRGDGSITLVSAGREMTLRCPDGPFSMGVFDHVRANGEV